MYNVLSKWENVVTQRSEVAMKKYRVQTNGTRFKVQARSCLFWSDYTNLAGDTVTFTSAEEAWEALGQFLDNITWHTVEEKC